MRKELENDRFEPQMPPLEAPYLIEFLWQVGPVMESEAGRVPLSHQEISAWQFNSGVSLQPWEARFLRNLSREYLEQIQSSKKPDCPPPFGFEERRAMVSKKIDEYFG